MLLSAKIEKKSGGKGAKKMIGVDTLNEWIEDAKKLEEVELQLQSQPDLSNPEESALTGKEEKKVKKFKKLLKETESDLEKVKKQLAEEIKKNDSVSIESSSLKEELESVKTELDKTRKEKKKKSFSPFVLSFPEMIKKGKSLKHTFSSYKEAYSNAVSLKKEEFVSLLEHAEGELSELLRRK